MTVTGSELCSSSSSNEEIVKSMSSSLVMSCSVVSQWSVWPLQDTGGHSSSGQLLEDSRFVFFSFCLFLYSSLVSSLCTPHCSFTHNESVFIAAAVAVIAATAATAIAAFFKRLHFLKE